MNHDAFSIAQKPLAVLSRSRSLPLGSFPRRSAFGRAAQAEGGDNGAAESQVRVRLRIRKLS